MSRIGRLPISCRKELRAPSRRLTSCGGERPKGELKQKIDRDFKVSSKKARCMYTALLSRKGIRRCTAVPFIDFEHVEGVSKGYRRDLELIGVGYKATAQGKCWIWAWVIRTGGVAVPSELKLQAVQEKGQNRWSFWKELTSNWSASSRKNKITSSGWALQRQRYPLRGWVCTRKAGKQPLII